MSGSDLTLDALTEYREIEGFAWPEPDHVRRVIGKVISGFGVGEDGQVAPVDDGPLRKLPKALPGDGELTASTRVRPDRTLVEAADRNPEQCFRITGQSLGCSQLIGIEIDVGVEVLDVSHPTKIVRHARLSSRGDR